MKVNISLRLITVATLLLALGVNGSAEPRAPRRITFRRGATKASVAGRLGGWDDKARYLIRLRAGQTMNLSVVGACPGCTPDVRVDSPAGANDTADPDMCQCRLEVSDTAAGDYRITVGENRKGRRWKGAFVLSVEVR